MVQLGSSVAANTGAAAACHPGCQRSLCQSQAQRTLHTCEVFCPIAAQAAQRSHVVICTAQRTLHTSMLELSDASQPSVSPSQISW